MAEVNDWTTYLSEEEKGLLHRAESYTPSYFAQKVAALRVLVEASQKALRAIRVHFARGGSDSRRAQRSERAFHRGVG